MTRTTTLTLLALLFSATSVAHAALPPEMAKNWQSITSSERTLPGELELRATGDAELRPKGQAVLTGKWDVPAAGVLQITSPEYGVAKMSYRLVKGQLTLVYEDKSEQKFRPAKAFKK